MHGLSMPLSTSTYLPLNKAVSDNNLKVSVLVSTLQIDTEKRGKVTVVSGDDQQGKIQ